MDLLSVFLSLFDKLRKSFILRTIVIRRAQPGPKLGKSIYFPILLVYVPHTNFKPFAELIPMIRLSSNFQGMWLGT